MTKTISATKKMLAMILAVLMIFSGMAVSASAADENPIPDFEAIVNDSATTAVPTITVEKFAQIDGKNVTVTISPDTNVLKSYDENGNYLYSNLTAGTKYTFTATYVNAEGKTFTKTSTKTLLIKQNPPAAPVPKKVTSTTITVAQDTACEYKIEKNDAVKTIVYDWTDKIDIFENLTPNTAYILSVRKKATDTKYASEPNSITVKTLIAADKNAADKPVLTGKTDKTITVKEVSGVQFSIDRGTTWQTSGTFTGLTPNTIYGVIARKNFDKAVQDPNPVSEILEVKTNTRPAYTAAPGKCTFTVAEGTIYAEKEIAVTVTGDGPAGSFNDFATGEYGDTKLVPQEVVIGDRTFPLTRSKDNVYVGYINPSAVYANEKNVEVKVVYAVHRHNGQSFVSTGTTDKSLHSIDVGAEWGILTAISEFFTNVANFFLNTLPQFITDIFGSEAVSNLFSGIMDLIGKIGKPTT